MKTQAHSKPPIAERSIGPIRSEWIRSIGTVAREPEVDDLNERRLDLPATHPSHVEWGGSESSKRTPITGGEEEEFFRAFQLRCPIGPQIIGYEV